MSLLKLAGTATAVAGVLSPSFAATVEVDDFSGGPHTVSLVSFAPPELALGSFASPGAVGGFRDVVVISETTGSFSAGVSFGTGGYASFNGSGRGGIVYDGVAGITDNNNDNNITPDELDYGLNLDLLGDCVDGTIHVNAFADLPNAQLSITLATSPTDYNTYQIDLTNVGAFADYYVGLFAPVIDVGNFDPHNVNAIAIYHDGGDFPNLDIRVGEFDVTCVIPEPGTWLAVAGVAGLAGLTWVRARSRKA